MLAPSGIARERVVRQLRPGSADLLRDMGQDRVGGDFAGFPGPAGVAQVRPLDGEAQPVVGAALLLDVGFLLLGEGEVTFDLGRGDVLRNVEQAVALRRREDLACGQIWASSTRQPCRRRSLFFTCSRLTCV